MWTLGERSITEHASDGQMCLHHLLLGWGSGAGAKARCAAIPLWVLLVCKLTLQLHLSLFLALQGIPRRDPDGKLLGRAVVHKPSGHKAVPDGMTIDASGFGVPRSLHAFI